MSSKAMSLKAKIKNYAKQNNIAAQVVLQNYMFECLLARLSKSSYRDKFVVKGGMLVAAIVGLDTRATMDLDTTLRNLPLTKSQIEEAFEEVFSIARDDDVGFSLKGIEPIRKDDIYGGYCVRVDAIYDTIITPLSIDVSTGDVITPNPVEYEFSGIFDEDVRINLWGYNIETILAEKLETILRRGIFSTRPRDYYDAYVLTTTQQINIELLKDAIKATAEHRGSTEQISEALSILNQIRNNQELINQWEKYQRQFTYAKDISYQQVIAVIENLLT